MTSQQAIEILEKRADVRAAFKLSFPDKSTEEALRVAIAALRNEGELHEAIRDFITELGYYDKKSPLISDANAMMKRHQEHEA